MAASRGRVEAAAQTAMRIRQRLARWYRGRYVPPPPSSRHVVFLTGHHEPSAPARFLRALVGFWLAHWQWIIGTALAVAALFLGVL
jgi:hypothetical protein